MSDTGTWPRPKAAWGMVALLTLAYLVSYIDRTILGLLVQPIKADLSLSDEQIGWVLGPAFAIGFQGLADRMVDDFVSAADGEA